MSTPSDKPPTADPNPKDDLTKEEPLNTGDEVKAEAKGEVKDEVKEEVKEDPDERPTPTTEVGTPYGPPTRVKKEEDHDDLVDLTVPKARGADAMFEDVDAAEVVDLTYEGIAEIDGVDHFVCEDFKIPQIPKPHIITRPLRSLHENIVSGHIILDPEYQREVVWDEGRASLLITSILMGYFIPPIIFNVKETTMENNGKQKSVYTRICVDGKQRLTSVHKFMTGQIGFFDSNSPQKKWFFCHPTYNGKEQFSNHNILPKAVKDFFMNQAFCCYEYTDMKPDTEETMFQLVQRGIALTPAEKMRAMSTEWATYTKQYEDDYVLIVNLSKQTRASGFRLILTIFTMIQEVISRKRKRSSAPTLQASPQSLIKVLEDREPIPNELKLKFKSVFDKYETLIKNCSDQITATRYRVKANSVFDPAPEFLHDPGVEHVRTFSPLELIGTAILVACHMEFRSEDELIEDIKSMRIYLRVKHKDLRVNAQCWFTVWEFTYEEMRRRRGIVELSLGGVIPMTIGPPITSTSSIQYASPYAIGSISPGASHSETSGSTTPARQANKRRQESSASSDLTSIGSTPEPTRVTRAAVKPKGKKSVVKASTKKDNDTKIESEVKDEGDGSTAKAPAGNKDAASKEVKSEDESEKDDPPKQKPRPKKNSSKGLDAKSKGAASSKRARSASKSSPQTTKKSKKET
ncbi:hypothetical protein BJ875DRAFT_184483 [Amylocarpus encephaloides]|uniref:GmrSD restriction endonucleases N-terminal domain-containing protein n=1 Tax=Amylocarpus encephaloides TaxID=45428 RepID=A0A9P7YPK3_9HELO|nr:hypothetical protein BJ875DRAFT_184483 [Amylocarpus encephaloides]